MDNEQEQGIAPADGEQTSGAAVPWYLSGAASAPNPTGSPVAAPASTRATAPVAPGSSPAATLASSPPAPEAPAPAVIPPAREAADPPVSAGSGTGTRRAGVEAADPSPRTQERAAAPAGGLPPWTAPAQPGAATTPGEPLSSTSLPAPAQTPRKAIGTRGLLIGGAVLALIVGAGGVGWAMHNSGSSAPSALPSTGDASSAVTESAGPTPSAGSEADSSTSSSTAGLTSAVATVDPEAAAVQQLNQLRADSLSRLSLDGRWVAQVASKSVGITDPLQTAQNGSHTFYAADILAESTAARSVATGPSHVYVLWSTDFGKSSTAPDGSPYWVTVVDEGFSSVSDVNAWCARTFSTLSPAALADTCAPRTLDPSHG